MVVVIAPNYNADGNEAVDLMNRTAQYGPVAGVGRRENVKGLDLNRDYMKLESAEARALAAAFTAWDPHLMIDLHTTNGSYHGYHLTHSIPLNLAFSQKSLDYHRDTMMPAIMKSLEAAHKTRSYYYGNFGRGNAAPGALRRWNSFDWRPRAGQNYVGIRNRLTILSEAYSYLSFKRRIEVTEDFVDEILKFVDAHRAEIVALTRTLDAEWIKRAESPDAIPLGVEYQMRPLPKPVEILVGEVKTGDESAQRAEHDGGARGQVQARTDGGLRLLRADADGQPRARLRPAERRRLPAHRRQDPPAWRRCRDTRVAAHDRGLSVRRRSDHEVAEAVPGPQRGQAEGAVYTTEKTTIAAGSHVVRLAQPLGLLAAYLLEPESDDGLTNWNFLDQWLEVGKPAPVRKIMTNVKMATKR